MLRPILFLLMLTTPLFSQSLLLTNAIIHPIEKGTAVTTAALVQDGKIVALGEEARRQASDLDAESVDFSGRHIFPGFIDAHAHVMGLGEQGRLVDLRGVPSLPDALARVRAALSAPHPPAWIRGRGWDQNRWEGKRFPHRVDLDALSSTHPICLTRIDGHAVWVNSAALAAAGITASTPDPKGGRILREPDGSPTGILLDNAVELVYARIPAPTPAEIEANYRAALEHCHRVGLTSVHDMGLSSAQIAVLRSMIARDVFTLRLVGYVDGTGAAWEDLLRTGRQIAGQDRLILDGLKLYADGALGSRGAALLEPYADDPGNRGIPIAPEDTIRREAVRALRAHLRMCVHAIGDAAIRTVLDAYAAAVSEVPGPVGRLRVEHVQVVDPEDLPRFARLGITASVQPTHAVSDMTWAEARLGPRRIRNAYPWAALRDASARLCGGSDFPIEKPDPIEGVIAACTRRDAQGRPASEQDVRTLFTLAANSDPRDPARYSDGWYGQQRLSRNQALSLFWSDAAAAAGLQGRMGTLAVGAWADFVVVDLDLETCPIGDLKKCEILETWSGGRRVYRKGE